MELSRFTKIGSYTIDTIQTFKLKVKYLWVVFLAFSDTNYPIDRIRTFKLNVKYLWVVFLAFSDTTKFFN